MPQSLLRRVIDVAVRLLASSSTSYHWLFP